MNKILKASVFFIIAYFLSQLSVYFWSRDNFFTSPMYILLPIVGFFAAYFLIPIIEKYTNWNFGVLLGLFLVICLITHFLVIYLYAYWVFVVMREVAMPKDLGVFKQLLESAFLQFIISVVIGMFASKKKIL